MYRVSEVAENFGVSIKTVRRWIARHRLTARREGRLVFIAPEDLDRFRMTMQKVGTGQDIKGRRDDT